MTEQLIQLAKVAGIGGLAFGVLVLIFREVIRKQIFPTLPPRQAYRLLRLIVVLTFTIALVGLIGWVYLEHLRSPFSELFRDNLKQKETEIFSVNSSANILLVQVSNPLPADAEILINDKDLHSQLKSETGSTGFKIYHFEGSPDQLNLSVGANKVVVKYGDTILPAFYFKYTDMQKTEAQRYFDQLQQIEKLTKQRGR